MTVEDTMAKLQGIVRENPKRFDQDDQARTLQVMGFLVAQIDGEEASRIHRLNELSRITMEYKAYPLVSPAGDRVDIPALQIDAFCTANGLDVATMRQVGAGQVGEHRGWKRSNGNDSTAGLGAHYLGAPWRDPAVQKKQAEEAKRMWDKDQLDTERINRGIREHQPVPYVPPITWTPEGK